MVELLLDISDDYTISDALVTAAADGRGGVVRLLLSRCQLERISVARALEKAAEFDRGDVLKLLLEGSTGEERGVSVA